ncbi:MAG: DUF1460 domain-containing protein [Ignavibacteriaceae bacterium]|nr:DUF1460 domain-containing protein [Ignavibacteriaceae bacterium]
MKKTALFLFLFLLPLQLNAQIYTQKDIEVCNSKLTFAADKNLKDQPLGDVIARIGKSFLGVDYEAHTLEKAGEEQLVVYLQGLDCTTFLENALVLARCVKQDKTSFEEYMGELQKIRYRDGVIDGYPSRLHYFSDWIHNNVKKGIVKDVTRELGGQKIRFSTGFMSDKPELYAKLKENPGFVPVIRKQEEEINKRDYYYLPNKSVESAYDGIRNGDLIAITTNLKGLDIGHVGIAVKEADGQVYFMHAPLVGAKVEITKDPLHIYLTKVKKHTGVIVLRPYEPK